MDRAMEISLKASLTKAIEHWMNERGNESIVLPYWVGNNIHAIMADAALSVLLGIADAQEYLRANDLLDE